MDDVVSAAVGRRAVLRWAAAGALAATVTLGVESHAQAAATADGDLSVGPTTAGRSAVLVPGSSQSVIAPNDLGVTVKGATSIEAGSIVALEYDPRLYELAQTVTAAHGATALAASRQSVVTDPQTGLTTVKVRVDEAIPAGGSTTVVVGHLRPRRYPLDILRDYGDVQASVTQRAGTRRRAHLGGRRSEPVAGQPWGCEAGVLWQPLEWGGGFRSYCARVASVRSTGPGAVPAGYRVRVVADPHVVRSISLQDARTLGGRRVSGSAEDVSTAAVRALEWTAHAHLPMGEQIQLRLAVTPADPVGALSGIKHPMVGVVGPAERRGTQRTTYLESVVNQNSIYDAESRARFA